jgi:hypothetical protein
MKKNEYHAQAEEFCKATGTSVTTYYTGKRKYFPDDKEARDVYSVTISRKDKEPYTFTYGDSIQNTQYHDYGPLGKWRKPHAYDVLACITKYPVEDSVDEFALEYGYTKPSEALRIHGAVREEWQNVSRLYNEAELEMLRAIA